MTVLRCLGGRNIRDRTNYLPLLGLQCSETIKLTGVVAGTEVGIYRTSDMLEYFHVDNSVSGDIEYTYSYTTDIPVYIVIHNNGYKYIKINTSLTANNLTIPIQQEVDRWYSNPA